MIDELNYKLEEALEDNITMQTEFEVYKQIMGEKLSRKSDELKEIKSDMFTKNLMIKKLKNKQEKKFMDSKYLDLDGKSTRKKINNENTKIKKLNSKNTYTRDNNFSITCHNENKFFSNISTNMTHQKNQIFFTEGNNPENLPTKSNKIISYAAKKKNMITPILNSYTHKMNSLETPSNIKMVKQNSSRNTYYSYKKHYDNENDFQEINNFNLNNIDYTDTTSGLSVLQKGIDESYNKDFYDYLLQNLDTNKKKVNFENDNSKEKSKKNYNNKSKTYKDAFMKRLLNPKNLNNNTEKLYYYNQRNKGNKYNKLNEKRKLLALK